MFAYCNSNPVRLKDPTGNCPLSSDEIKYHIANELSCEHCGQKYNATDAFFAMLNEYWGGKVMPVQKAKTINHNDYPNYEFSPNVPHRGTDIIYEDCYGARVYSATPGEVDIIYTDIDFNTWDNPEYEGIDTYGLCVCVKYEDVTIIYAHLSEICVYEGQIVEQWDLIGYVGDTGRATEPHLHFEVNRDGCPISPYPYLP